MSGRAYDRLRDDRPALSAKTANFRLRRGPESGARSRPTIRENALDDFCGSAIGRAKEAADILIRSGHPAIIDAAGFRRQFQAFVRKYDLGGLLISTEEPDPETIKAKIDSAPVFVRQLSFINVTPEILMEAVSDFLRTSADKTKWAADGDVVADSFDAFEEGLRKHYVIARDEVEDVHAALTEDARGRFVYRKCAMLKMPLEGRVVPAHFVPGAFNILADNRTIGWHPKYDILLGDI